MSRTSTERGAGSPEEQTAERYENLGDKAPIVEALVDVRVRCESPPGVHVLKAAAARCKSDYPVQQEQRFWTGVIQLGADSTSTFTQRQGPRGVVLRSADDRRVVQFRVDGFSFSHLRPYDSWDSLRKDARAMWLRYAEAVSPREVTRCAVRYINRIEFPHEDVDLHDWLETAPVVAPSLGVDVADFLMRLVLPHGSGDSVAILTLASDRGGDPPRAAVVLDIDAFAELRLQPGDPLLWERLEALRAFKNDVFFKTITRKTRGLFV